MRNPDRIDPIIEKLRATWRADPDLRLGQLVVNLAGGSDPFNVEDNVMEAHLDNALAAVDRIVTAPEVLAELNRLRAKVMELHGGNLDHPALDHIEAAMASVAQLDSSD